MDGVLYRASGRPVMPSQEEDVVYCDAYRRLFGRLGCWPPDGVYSFDGEEMALEHAVPWAQLLAQAGVM